MINIAIVSSNKWINKVQSDKALNLALNNEGINSQIVSWEEYINWLDFDLIILRSTWDYYGNYKRFCEWLKYLKQSRAHVANGIDRILCNINKTTQFETMSNCPISLIPSIICNNYETAQRWITHNRYDKVVVKPSISASGHNTFLVEKEKSLDMAITTILHSGVKFIVQPYIEEIETGEVSLIYFNGNFSHALLRFPGVIGTKSSPVPLDFIDQSWICAGNAISTFINAKELLYLRIDLVRYKNCIHVMELELTEPELYLDLNYQNCNPQQNFISAIKRYLFRT